MGERREIDRLVDAARCGDSHAFGELFDRFYQPIYRYAFTRLGSISDAEDAAAETFMSALGALPRFAWRGAPFEAWLFRIAASKVADVWRERARRAPHRASAATPDRLHEPDPAMRYLAVERSQRLFDAVERLPAAQRDVILLRFVAQRSVAEVAAILGCSEGSVKQRRLRAVVRLRTLLPGER